VDGWLRRVSTGEGCPPQPRDAGITLKRGGGGRLASPRQYRRRRLAKPASFLSRPVGRSSTIGRAVRRHSASSSDLAFGLVLASEIRMPEAQRTVYILQSTTQQQRYYTGITSNLEWRLRAHNTGLSRHTASGRPWRVVVTVEFADPDRAAQFEIYLKSGSGRAFAARHLR